MTDEEAERTLEVLAWAKQQPCIFCDDASNGLFKTPCGNVMIVCTPCGSKLIAAFDVDMERVGIN